MGSALHRSFFRGMVVGGLQLSSPVTLSRNGWVATVFTGHSFEEWVGSALHRSLFRGIGVWCLQALWSLGVFRRAVQQRAGCYSLVLGPLQVCPHNPPLLPLPPVETPPRAASAPPQAGHKHRCPAATPCPSRSKVISGSPLGNWWVPNFWPASVGPRRKLGYCGSRTAPGRHGHQTTTR